MPLHAGAAALVAADWDNGHLARCDCTSTTTLKNRIAAFSSADAPSTAFHSPFNTITLTANAAILAAVGRGVPASRCVPYRLPVTNALKSLSQEVPTAFTE